MPASEIDDIFAGKVVSIQSSNKRKAEAITASDGTDALTANGKVKKKKKKKKSGDNLGADTTKSDAPISTTTTEPKEGRNEKDATKQSVPGPMTVVDPSAKIEGHSSKAKLKKPGKKKASDADDANNESRFRDSRGSGPRKLYFVWNFFCYYLHERSSLTM